MTQSLFHCWKNTDGSTWAEFHRTAGGYLVRFPGLADFSVSADGNDIRTHPAAGVSEEKLSHLYQNQVLPLALSRRDELVLHAGAVEMGGNAVAFLGKSGAGKSTLTASFATNGHRFLTDDGLQLTATSEGYLARPSYPAIRLWDDSSEAVMPQSAVLAPNLDFTDKAKFLAGDSVVHCNDSLRLRVCYLLGRNERNDGNGIVITPLPAREAMMELVKGSFLLDIEDHTMLRRHFSYLGSLAASLQWFVLDYPRDYALLPAVRHLVQQHVQSLAG